ncbi:MAG TPA: RidA family protein [Gammaproteobacteria bacterium]|nr:RidA family protein [Xanthomonadales bacterium]MCB1593531.1 RidA family protein [Xanthomonadales bacterium]HOP21869.1 RidA family protein [Gammaproteobacteria bacterium]HPI95432.1 RidA family protein [Gammaproteobacteria bacterium]HPQ86639.1 RidA family protein [Gammaproteobacteria bacterium]
MMKKIIETQDAPAAIGTYSQAVTHNNVLYVSGQIPINPKSGEMREEDFSKQTHQVFRNLQAIAIAAGTSLQNTLKLNIFVQDLSHFATLNDIMSQYFEEPYPARAAIEVAGLPKNAMIEMDAIIAIQ